MKRPIHRDSEGPGQEAQYDFPYHYLPEETGCGFRQHRYWSWGYRYLGRLRVVFDLLQPLAFESLLDVGCGDGRFLRETRRRYPAAQLRGIDPSGRAVALARRLNSGLDFVHGDVSGLVSEPCWDVITLLEVLEHIPPDELPSAVSAIHRLLTPGGTLVLTAPHTNTRLPGKHHQHFDAEKLRSLFSGEFDELRCFGFDYIDFRMKVLLRAMGGAGKFYIVTHRGMNNLLYRYYSRHCLYGTGSKRCQRIAFVATKRE